MAKLWFIRALGEFSTSPNKERLFKGILSIEAELEISSLLRRLSNMFRLRWFSQLVALASEATVHYQDVIFHSILPDCLLVTETTGVCALTVSLF